MSTFLVLLQQRPKVPQAHRAPQQDCWRYHLSFTEATLGADEEL